ncbi:MAG: hypothetical protein FWE91_03125 [Defluviitaleaceae bacterium]|nr:hypothetical protein [Defluviitaleaceae bacterium]
MKMLLAFMRFILIAGLLLLSVYMINSGYGPYLSGIVFNAVLLLILMQKLIIRKKM